MKMETPVEILQKELSCLKTIASLPRHGKKKESKKLIPIFENAIKILNEVAVREVKINRCCFCKCSIPDGFQCCIPCATKYYSNND